MTLRDFNFVGSKGKAFAVATQLAKKMASDQWMSTQTTAYCLLAMSKFAQNNGQGITIQYKKNGKVQAIKTMKSIANRSLEVRTGLSNDVSNIKITPFM
jgi:hypothetical protein